MKPKLKMIADLTMDTLVFENERAITLREWCEQWSEGELAPDDCRDLTLAVKVQPSPNTLLESFYEWLNEQEDWFYLHDYGQPSAELSPTLETLLRAAFDALTTELDDSAVQLYEGGTTMRLSGAQIDALWRSLDAWEV